MMIIETPGQSDIVLKYLNSKNSLDWPIVKSTQVTRSVF